MLYDEVINKAINFKSDTSKLVKSLKIFCMKTMI